VPPVIPLVIEAVTYPESLVNTEIGKLVGLKGIETCPS
jgi:hypothetical protein